MELYIFSTVRCLTISSKYHLKVTNNSKFNPIRQPSTAKRTKGDTFENIPHASSALQRVGSALEGAIEVAMHLMLPLPALVDQRQLKKCPHVRTFAGERDEDRHIHRIVLGILPVGIEVNRPVEPAHREQVARDVLPRSHPLRERIPPDRKTVGPIHRLVHGFGGRAGRRLCPGALRLGLERVCF